MTVATATVRAATATPVLLREELTPRTAILTGMSRNRPASPDTARIMTTVVGGTNSAALTITPKSPANTAMVPKRRMW